MHIRRFEAPTLLEAVRRVRETLGPDALVLETRRLRRGGVAFGLFGRSVFEVVAAVDRDVRRGEVPARLHGASARDATASAGSSLDGQERGRPDRSWDELRLVRSLLGPIENELRRLRGTVDALSRPAEAQEELADELARLRECVRGLASSGASVSAAALDPLAARLVRVGVDASLASRLAAEARSEAEHGEPVVAALRQRFAARLDARLVPPRDDCGPQIELIVGPPGAGKTTTLAKLATRGARAGQGVGLVSTDVHRTGADAALRTLADLSGAPFALVTNPDDLVRAIDRLGSRRIWIDTAGRGPQDAEAFGALVRGREALGDRARVSLVVSATTRSEDLRAAMQRHRTLRPDGLVLTHLDETTLPGIVANLALDESLPPVRWLGIGQRVPEDLELPEPARIVSRIWEAAA